MARRQHTGDPRQLKVRADREAYWDGIDAADRAFVMQTEQGRRFIERQLLWVMQVQSFTDDPYRHAFNSGRRSFSVTLWNQLLKEQPQEFMALLREQTKRMVEDDIFQRQAARIPPESSEPEPEAQP